MIPRRIDDTIAKHPALATIFLDPHEQRFTTGGGTATDAGQYYLDHTGLSLWTMHPEAGGRLLANATIKDLYATGRERVTPGYLRLCTAIHAARQRALDEQRTLPTLSADPAIYKTARNRKGDILRRWDRLGVAKGHAACAVWAAGMPPPEPPQPTQLDLLALLTDPPEL